MKRLVMYGAVAVFLAMAVMVSPASAQTVVRVSTCTATDGSNTMTYDCGFNVKNYSLDAPVTFNVTWTCTGTCGPATSFSLSPSGFTPAGVSGHMLGAKLLTNGLQLTFAFDSLKNVGGGYTGNAHFTMGVNMDDGTGTTTSIPCGIDVHLQE
jgi:hypothetical protein